MNAKFTLLSCASTALAGVILLSSCSTSVDVAKRRYNQGYYVSISSGKSTKAYVPQAKVTAVKPLPAATELTASVKAAEIFLRRTVPAAGATDNTLMAWAQKTNVNPLPAKMGAGNPSGNYERGEISFKEVKALIKEQKKNAKRDTPFNKSKSTALILCIFLGVLGVHRFYMQFTWQGVVQLCTAGGLGIWWLVDIIRISVDRLWPKHSRFN